MQNGVRWNVRGLGQAAEPNGCVDGVAQNCLGQSHLADIMPTAFLASEGENLDGDLRKPSELFKVGEAAPFAL
jgi:hypothetical protein